MRSDFLRSTMANANAGLGSDQELIFDLQLRLKVPRSTDVPSADHVRIALRLARDQTIDTTKGFWPKEVKSSATRTRIKALGKRMIDEGHLAAAESALTQPVAVPPPRSNFGLGDEYDELLVQPAWLAEHVPRLRFLPAKPLFLLGDRQTATREVVAYLGDELVCRLVEYQLPPANGESKEDRKARRDRHRRRCRRFTFASTSRHR